MTTKMHKPAKGQRVVGLSLSFCVNDIIYHTVRLEDVDRLIVGVRAASDADWQMVVDDYCESYWQYDTTWAREIVATLRHEGKIDQPRLRGESTHNIADGWWVAADATIPVANE